MNHRPFSSQRYASRPLIRQVYRSPTPPAERQAARRTSRTASTGYLWPASNSTTSGVPSYVILTTAANDSMRKIHDRMPLVLTREQIGPWLTDPDATERFLGMTPPPLDAATTDAQIRLW